MELSINLSDKKTEAIYIQIYQYIKEAIMSGDIKSDDRLPSVRRFANDLAVSRTTIENAYSQLLAEGYIYSMPQKGYFAAELEKHNYDVLDVVGQRTIKIQKTNSFQYELKNEYAEDGVFNFNIWKKHTNQIMNYRGNELCVYGDIQGEVQLREEIIKYIFRTRGGHTTTEHIVVGAGIQPLLNILASILWQKGIRKLAIEDPGFNRAKSIFSRNHYDIVPISINEKGIAINEIKEKNVRLCYITPSYQFPMGTVMLVDNRMKLIKWAYDYDGYIIEDDFNSELRYEGKPIPAMKGLDKSDRVIYVGSFSSVLVPSIRLSFMILPEELRQIYETIKDDYSQTASKLDQLALANMIKSGDFERHIRRLRKYYGQKNKMIISEFDKYFQGIATIVGSKSGFNILLKFSENISIEQLIIRCMEEGINIATLDEYSINNKGSPVLVLNYRGITNENVQKVVEKLYEIVINM